MELNAPICWSLADGLVRRLLFLVSAGSPAGRLPDSTCAAAMAPGVAACSNTLDCVRVALALLLAYGLLLP